MRKRSSDDLSRNLRPEGPPLAAGLTAAEAARRLRAEGPNALPRPRPRGAVRLVLDVLKEPMLSLLLAGGAIYLLLGDRAEGAILLAFAGLSVGLTVVQEARTERVLDALRDLTSPRALVIRDGQRLRIAGQDLVRGDLIALSEGDRVPADAQLQPGAELTLDESLLTGEAVPVRKSAARATARVFSGTLVVGGSAEARVIATGAASEIGRIGTSLALLDPETPHLQRQMRGLVLWFALLGGAVSLGVVALYGMTRGGDWLQALLAGIAVGMSMLPEEFPMVLAVFMAMGAWRISKAGVLTRRASAIETLGAASVLCTDKTGTLTENRMTIASLQLADGSAWDAGAALAPAFQGLAQAGTRASAPAPFDPMETAFHRLSPLGAGRLIRSYPLRPELLAMTQVWRQGDAVTAYAKGAPEAIAALCGLAPETLRAQVDRLAATGQRVLAVAQAETEAAAIHLGAPHFGMAEAQTRALSFAALVMTILALILVNRARSASVLTALSRRNRALGVILAAVMTVLALVLGGTQIRTLFGFALPPGAALAMPLLAGAVVLVLLELFKAAWSRFVLARSSAVSWQAQTDATRVSDPDRLDR